MYGASGIPRGCYLIVSVLVALLHNGCAEFQPAPTGDLSETTIRQPGIKTEIVIPELPFPPQGTAMEQPRSCESTSSMDVEGSDFLQARGSNNYKITDSSDYVITSSDEDAQAWALFGLSGFTDQRPRELELDVTSAPAVADGEDNLPLNFWCGIANFTKYSWEWLGPFNSGTAIELNSPLVRDRYVSAENAMYFTIFLMADASLASIENPGGNAAVRINGAAVKTMPVVDSSYFTTRPHYPVLETACVSDPGEPAISLAWSHVSDTACTLNEAQNYYVYRKCAADEIPVFMGVIDAPDVTYNDPSNNSESVLALIPGLDYRYYLRASNEAGNTPCDSSALTIPPKQPGQHQLVITSYGLKINGATGGAAPSGDIFGVQATHGDIRANSSVDLSLAWISGVFDGVTFSGNNPNQWPPGLLPTMYDTAFLATRDCLTWYIQNAGALGCRRTSDWLTLSNGTFPLSGDPGNGVVFPDDDPDSADDNPEALLITYLPSFLDMDYPDSPDLKVHVVYSIQYSTCIDIIADPAAPRLIAYHDAFKQPLTELYHDQPTDVYIEFEWGIQGPPTDFASTCLEFYSVLDNGLGVDTNAHFDYSSCDPQIDEYSLETIEDYLVIHIMHSGANLADTGQYIFRFCADDKMSSINKPDVLLKAGTAPPLPVFSLLPTNCAADTDEIQLFFSDPRLRRDPSVYYDTIFDSVFPVVPSSYSDVLKPNGEEFLVAYTDCFYPQVAVVEGSDPDIIASLDDNLEGIFTFNQNPNKLCIDISVITPMESVGSPTRIYSYKVFNDDGAARGSGIFTVSPTNYALGKPSGVNWGVNAFNRTARSIENRDFTLHSVNASSIFDGSPTPDVLWFEIAGGWMFDCEQNDKHVYHDPAESQANNVMIKATNNSTDEYCYLSTAARIAGIGPMNTYIMIHSLTPEAFTHPTKPDWPGILESENTYTLMLDDPHWPGVEFAFDDLLTVTGNNPNNP